MKHLRNIGVLALLLIVAGTTKANAGQQPATILVFSKDYKKYEKMIRTISKRHDVSPQLIKALIQVESNFDHQAMSEAGAMGLMQLMPDTAARFGVHSAFEPAQNIEGGVRYLKHLLKLFKSDMELALAAYNAGEGRVLRTKAIPKFVETQNYVRKVLALYKGEMSYIPYTAGNRFS